MVTRKLDPKTSKRHSMTRKTRGFSLVEVLTATIVMTMMMVAVIAYIQYGAMVWQKGQTKIAAKNYSRMAFDLIKQDLMKAIEIEAPHTSTLVTVENALAYKMLISGTTETFKIGVPDSKMVLQRLIGSADLGKQKSWNTRMARNVSLFQVERISTWTLKISLQIRTDEEDLDIFDREIVSSESIVLTAPAAGG